MQPDLTEALGWGQRTEERIECRGAGLSREAASLAWAFVPASAALAPAACAPRWRIRRQRDSARAHPLHEAFALFRGHAGETVREISAAAAAGACTSSAFFAGSRFALRRFPRLRLAPRLRGWLGRARGRLLLSHGLRAGRLEPTAASPGSRACRFRRHVRARHPTAAASDRGRRKSRQLV